MGKTAWFLKISVKGNDCSRKDFVFAVLQKLDILTSFAGFQLYKIVGESHLSITTLNIAKSRNQTP